MFITTAALQLEDAAAAYRSAATTLKTATQHTDDYLTHLHDAEEVQWHSDAAEAFRLLLSALREPGGFLSSETEALAAEADLIAAELTSYAATARQLSQIVDLLSAVDLPALMWDLGADQVAGLRSAAADAVTDADEFLRFVHDNGGIPGLLLEAAARLW
ncbi:hypothetical protein [Nesterenkonia sp.]|uniref:hypothetical protein n=1 Tax=Nesterenkonia sp. TaxID=704201 RepID=UPI00262AC76C|nr:hypothetical protein [Nesterenkonia sp.]